MNDHGRFEESNHMGKLYIMQNSVFFSRYYTMLIMYVSHITVVFLYQEQWNFILLNFVLLRYVYPSILDQIPSL